MRSLLRWTLVMGCLYVGLPASALAQAYSYVDEGDHLHIVESLHEVPEAYRATARPMGGDEPDAPRSLEELLGMQQRDLDKVFFAQVNMLRRAQGLLPLSHAQKREWSGFFRTWTPLLVLSHVPLLLVCLWAMLHMVRHARGVWFVLTLLFLLPGPVYCARNMLEDKDGMKLVVYLAALLPAGALGWFGWQLVQLFNRLLSG